MSRSSRIEWTDSTWNPVTGCTKVSPGCRNCYAERIAYRFAGMHGFPARPHHFDVTLRHDRLQQPCSWRKPLAVFVCSMSDLFHQAIPTEYIQEVFAIMRTASNHTFQVLTKRSERLLELNAQIDWPSNVWMGVSIESQEYEFRSSQLKETGAGVKFLSLEPLLGPMPDLDLQGVDWVIVGGESGPRARSMNRQWVIDIKDQCKMASVPFFFKQWGGVIKKRNGRQLEGRTWDEMPRTNAAQQLVLRPIR